MTAYTINLNPVIDMTDEQFYQLCGANSCPDFVLELRSPSDALQTVQAKLIEYIDNGAELGWLINPQDQQVEIYRPNQSVTVLQTPDRIAGDPVLPDFVLNLTWLWQ